MKPLLNRLLLALALVGLCPAVQASGKGAPAPDQPGSIAIINGNPGTTADFPWMAFLADAEGQQFCGASLISSHWVLTAAHCFLNEANNAVDLETGANARVVLNSDAVEPLATGAINAAIARIIIHPQYQPDESTSPNSNDFDIALVELTENINLPVVSLLASGATPPAEGSDALILGWGSTAVNADNESVDPSNTLLRAQQRFVSQASCAEVYGSSLTGNMLCAGGLTPEDTTDTCQGDSGGPLTVVNGGTHTQVGIVSFGGRDGGPPCADAGVPGVYASVSVLSGFIREHVNDALFVTLGARAGGPVTGATVAGTAVTIRWTAVTGATGYRLYYAPFPAQSPISQLDMGANLQIQGELPSGSAFYFAIEPYNAAGAMSTLSNIGVLQVP